MSGLKNIRKIPLGIPAAFLVIFFMLPLIFSACNNVVGFGNPIDFEPPKLSLDPGPNPWYVNKNTVLAGDCSDNIAVARVVCRNTNDNSIVYGTAKIVGTRWSMSLTFTSDDNGKKIPVEIRAWDKAGNSGSTSVANITLIVDTGNPVFNEATIYRSSSRLVTLQGLNDLKVLEQSDPNADKAVNVENYQNGTFWIRAKVDENETSLQTPVLYIYDADHDSYDASADPNDQSDAYLGPYLIKYDVLDTGSNPFAPQWTVKETDLVRKGDNAGYNYTNRLAGGERLYFRVRIAATDLAGNRVEDFNYFCLLPSADVPKASVGGGMAIGNETIYASAGTEIPVDVFDDDTLQIAYVDLLTADQYKKIGDAIGNSADTAILNEIQKRLSPDSGSPQTVWNYKNKNNYDEATLLGLLGGDQAAVDAAKVTNIIGTTFPESLTQMVKTSTDPSDYGDYKLIAIAKDKKDPPHIPGDDSTKPDPVWNYFVFKVTVRDNNAPLIVIDTVVLDSNGQGPAGHLGEDTIPGASSGNSPEENTFPKLDQGRYFTINGYTLDENSQNRGRVAAFKMAWIPFNIPGGQDGNLAAVQKALQTEDSSSPSAYPAGVQHWQLPELVNNYNPATGTYDDVYNGETSYIITGTQQYIGTGTSTAPYTKQTFKKRFDILGGQDDLNPSYTNFNYICDATKIDSNGNVIPQTIPDPDNPGSTIPNPAYGRENAAKLFVLYARDIDGNEFFRTIRLLGNTTPPGLKVYDFTARPELDVHLDFSQNNDNPNAIIIPSSGFNSDIPTDYSTPGNSQLQNYQGFYQNFYNGILQNGSGTGGFSDSDLSQAFQPYPRGKINKLYIQANDGGGIQIDDFRMYNITRTIPAGDPSNPTGQDLKFDPVNLTNPNNQYFERGYIDPHNGDMIYVEALPDLLQRVYLFTARNKLGTEVRIQRTIAVTSTALLEDVISTSGSGTYGVDSKIKLQAHFSGQVKVAQAANGAVPVLNIRWQKNTPGGAVWVYEAVPYSGPLDSPSMYLDFDWVVPENATGRLETVDFSNGLNVSDAIAHVKNVPTDNTNNPYDRPIYLNGATILDAERLENAFLPTGQDPDLTLGYILTWNDSRNSLQGMSVDPEHLDATYPGTQIVLDGIRPTISSFTVGGKTAYSGIAARDFYFKSGETIQFTLQASKNIHTAEGTSGDPSISGKNNPRIAYQIWYPNLTGAGNTQQGGASATYYADYLRPDGKDTMVFTIDVTGDAASGVALDPPYDGTIKVMGLDTSEGNIVDDNGNALSASDLAAQYTSFGATVIMDRVKPPNTTPWLQGRSLPWVANQPNPGDPAAPAEGNYSYNYNPVLTMNGVAGPGSGAEPWGALAEYSLDNGLSWKAIHNPTQADDYKDGWTVWNDPNLNIESGQWSLRTRQTDKAGNTSDMSQEFKLDIVGVFPTLVSVSAVQPDKNYIAGDSLEFWLDFDRQVVKKTDGAYIVLTDTEADVTADPSLLDGTAPNSIKLPLTSVTGSTLVFDWNLTADSKQMPNGLTVAKIYLGGVEDVYGNPGAESHQADLYPGTVVMYADTSKTTDVAPPYPANLNGSGLKVFTFSPKLDQNATRPSNADPSNTGHSNDSTIVLSGDRKTITLVFDQEVVKGQGTITIKPHGNYAIPPVFPADRQVLSDGTIVDSFWDVYSRLSDANRRVLLTGANSATDPYADPALGLLTGLYIGPYKLSTQGLVAGAGYPADPVRSTNNPTPVASGSGYDAAATNWNTEWSDDPANNYMVPDTRAKYVLDFRYPIMDTTTITGTYTFSRPEEYYYNGAVTSLPALDTQTTLQTKIAAIRTALTAAKFRWQEIDVLSGSVVVNPANKKEVTVTLNSPLPKGLQWDLNYTNQCFSDAAGNSAVPPSSYWFWSDGVQTPVIRVDRKSMDNRAIDNLSGLDSDSKVLAWNDASGASNSFYYRVGNGSFANVAYRMESETPGASITYATLAGVGSGTPAAGQLAYAGIVFNWSGNIGSPATSWLARNGTTYQTGWYTGSTTTSLVTNGSWVLPNLIRRATAGGNYTGNTPNPTGIKYTVTQNGIDTTYQGNGSYWGLRSYNRDARVGDFPATTGTAAPATYYNVLPLSDTLSASKNYVVADAKVSRGGATTPVERGYEGIFKTVVVLNSAYSSQSGFFNVGNGSSPVQLFGSDSLTPKPVTPGFPVKMQIADLRYLKLMSVANGSNMYWVSTDIVVPWFVNFCCTPNGADLMSRPYNRSGDAGSYLSGGYGDLTYSSNQDITN